MSEITIVTAFFDIGRGNWKPSVQKFGAPLPHYLERSNSVYIERFSHLCKLENKIIVYTSAEIAPELEAIKTSTGKENLIILPIDVFTEFSDLRSKIKTVMNDPEFPKKINPTQILNPEYWCEDYVLVTSLKAHFVNRAINSNLIDTELASFVDFGYCRNSKDAGQYSKWTYDFNPDKVHFFICKEPNFADPNACVGDAVINNSVYIIGACVVAEKSKWTLLEASMRQNLEHLMSVGLVDDDQGLWLMCCLQSPQYSELRMVDYWDSMVAFRNFNNG